MKKQPERKRPEVVSERKVYSYYGGNRQSVDPANSAKKPQSVTKAIRIIRRWSITRWLVLIGLLVIIGSFIWVDTTPIIRVGDNDRPAREISEYRTSAQKIISGSLLNRTKLTFDYSSTEKQLMALYPEVADMSISFDLAGRKPVIQLSFHPPAVKVNTKGSIWVVDERGIAIARESDGRLSVTAANLPLVKDDIGIGGEAGKALLSATDVVYITTLVSIINAKGLPSATLTIPLVPKEIDVQLAGEGYRTKFNLDEDVTQQAGTWLAARETLASKGELPSEYLDIRAGEKVFWK